MVRAARWLAVLSMCLVAFACTKQYGDNEAPGDDDDHDNVVKDSGSSVTTPPPVDSGPITTTDSGLADAGAPACRTCPCAVPATTPPLPAPGSRSALPCRPSDVQLYLDNEDKTFDEAKAVQAAANALCAACIFTKESDTTWGPVVKTDDGRRYVNFATCYAVDGARTACAEAWHAFEWCRQSVCNICLDGENPDDCLNDAKTAKCVNQFNTADSNGACDNGDLDVVSGADCARSGNVVQFLCGGN